MKYFLDTNIIIILFEGRNDEIRDNVKEILNNEANTFFMSSISLLEIAQLYRKKRFKNIDYNLFDTGDKLISYILHVASSIKVLPFEAQHALRAGQLCFVPNHNDPNDLAIIAHAITERLTIISCDDKFPAYELQGAKVIHNRR